MLATIVTTIPPTLPVALSSISICIALAAFTVAFWNFRLSRFPHVRLLFSIHYTTTIQDPVGAHFFDVEVESWGLPIYDMKVWLVGDYRLGYGDRIGIMSFELQPVGTRPSPLNPGQVVKFRTTADFIQQRDKAPYTKPRSYGLSDLPWERVYVVVNGSGGREVKRVTSDRFGPQFWDFDCVNTKERMAKWKRYASRWRKWIGLNLFVSLTLSRVKPRFHLLRVRYRQAKEMRDLMRRSRRQEKKRDGKDG